MLLPYYSLYSLLKHFCSMLSIAIRICASSDILLSFLDLTFSDSVLSSIYSTLISSSRLLYLEISLLSCKMSWRFSFSYLSMLCLSLSDLSSSSLLLTSRFLLASTSNLYLLRILPMSSNSSGYFYWTISKYFSYFIIASFFKLIL